MNPRFRIFRAPAMAVAIALIARGVVLVSFHGTPFTRVMVGDSLGYRATAGLIEAGRFSEIGVFFQSAPLYPFFLAAVSTAFGPGWLPVAILQSVVGSLACGAVAWTAGRAFRGLPAVPWLAGAGAALYGPLVFHDLEVLPASLAASLLAFGLLIFLRGKAIGVCRGIVNK